MAGIMSIQEENERRTHKPAAIKDKANIQERREGSLIITMAG